MLGWGLGWVRLGRVRLCMCWAMLGASVCVFGVLSGGSNYRPN